MCSGSVFVFLFFWFLGFDTSEADLLFWFDFSFAGVTPLGGPGKTGGGGGGVSILQICNIAVHLPKVSSGTLRRYIYTRTNHTKTGLTSYHWI